MNSQTAHHAGLRAEQELKHAFCRLPGVSASQVFESLRVPLWRPDAGAGHDAADASRPFRAEGKVRVVSTSSGPVEWVDVEHPSQAQQWCRKGEIDLVVLTPSGIFCVEIKHWSGDVCVVRSPDSGQIVWQQQRRGGGTLFHKDPLQKIRAKAASLAEHAQKHGICIPSTHIFPRLVFTNSNLRFDTVGAAHEHGGTQQEQIVLPHQVDAFVDAFARTLNMQVAHTILPKWLTGCKVSDAVIAELGGVLASTCRTWDVLYESDGTCSRGDFISVHARDAAASHGIGSPHRHDNNDNKAAKGTTRTVLGFPRAEFARLDMYPREKAHTFMDTLATWFWPGSADHEAPTDAYEACFTKRAVDGATATTMLSALPWFDALTTESRHILAGRDTVVFHKVGSEMPCCISVGDIDTIILSAA